MNNTKNNLSSVNEHVRVHYEIEKELATRLRVSTREERRSLYKSVYDELYQRIPFHSQLIRKRDEAISKKDAARQYGLLKHFIFPECRFLEIGPGDCSLSLEMARHVKEVYAVDVSDEITKRIDSPPNFHLILSDGTSIPVLPESIDVAYSRDLMEHLHPDDVSEQLGNIRRALRVGGIYICVTPNRLCGPHDISRDFDQVATGLHLKEYAHYEVADLFRKTGFRKVYAVLSYEGKILTPLLPIFPFLWIEFVVERLPHAFRKKLGRILIAIKVIGQK